ncbi:hypothetical protein H0E87_015053 [Populus deltoides]|uniref:R13L1/DRL21-like LRR repeat region domain-containing protein n=1 Tax=Populus deltoides TaxID=3696 RepID=A0A8T2Y3M3_POPDE|nr:hypothetical protein H0E87_015053 [Populus deltoides]
MASLHTKARHMTLTGREKQFHPIIFNLKNLRTLQVLQKDVKTAPPDLFHGMQCLRGLDLSHTSITGLPSAVGRLFHLRWLNLSGLNFVVLPDTFCKGHLEISGLEKVRNVNEVMEANLKNKEHLRSLDLAFSFGGQELITNVLEALQPHPNLEALLVYDYAATRRTMPCLRSLSLYDCPKLKAIPEGLKQRPLEELIITRCPILE